MDPNERTKIIDNLDYFVQGTDNFTTVLNKLIEKNVFSPEMVDKIQNGGTERNKKRIMFKMIPKRGPHVFQLLYNIFIECKLYDLAKILKPGTISVKPAVVRMDTDSKKVYQMGSRPKGYMLLIIIDECILFPNWNSSNDEENLVHLWQSLGYIVHTHRNLTKMEMIEEIKKFRGMRENENVDSCVVHILSPSYKNVDIYQDFSIYCADGKPIQSETLMTYFDSLNCDFLKGKPKIFFFHLYGFPNIKIECDYSQGESEKLIPDSSDLYFVNYLVSGDLSSSLFIEWMARIFSAEAHKTDLESMLSKVSNETKCILIADLNTTPLMKRESRGFDKLFYFNPGLYD